MEKIVNSEGTQIEETEKTIQPSQNSLSIQLRGEFDSSDETPYIRKESHISRRNDKAFNNQIDKMKRQTKIIVQDDKNVKFNTQKQFDQFNIPFTFNPVKGCSLACKYCFSPIFTAKVPVDKGKKFFEESIIQMNAGERAAAELNRLRNLPQHLKRIQINESSEYYQPRVLHEVQRQGRDVMLEILTAFQNASVNGNSWMIHFLTKSNGIVRHIPKLIEMRDMVQVEMSFATPHEPIRLKLELWTLPISERLKIVEEIAKAGIFVRIMAMPFYGEEKDLELLKTMTFNAGAKAIKNKGINYYDWNDVINASYDDLIHDRIKRVSGRPDTKNMNYIIKSGELFGIVLVRVN